MLWNKNGSNYANILYVNITILLSCSIDHKTNFFYSAIYVIKGKKYGNIANA